MADRLSRHLALAASLIVSGSVSCVYFNTYYNAEKYFRQAEKARAQVEEERAGAEVGRSHRGGRGASYESLYDKAVRKASIVLEKYPESDLVDDAMFLAGKALYWQRDYAYGARSFRDLEENFPDSEFVDRARLWRARCLRDLGDEGEARALFTALVLESSHIGDQAGMELGDMTAAGGDLRAAVHDYHTTLSAFPRTSLADQLWLRIGNAYLSLQGSEDLDSAGVAYDRALREAREDSVEYRARLNRGRVLYRQGRPAPALDAYRSLLREGRFRTWEGETRILIGRYHRDNGALPDALEEFERVRDDFPGTGVSAMALYQTGLVYLQDRGDRQQAQEHLKEVGRERRGSEADSLARVMLETTDRLDVLLEDIYRADSTAAAQQFGSHGASREGEADSAAAPPSGALSLDASNVASDRAKAAAAPDTAASAALPADSTMAPADSTELPDAAPTLGPLPAVAGSESHAVARDSLGVLGGAVTAAALDTAAVSASPPADSTRVQAADSTDLPTAAPPLDPQPVVPEGLEGHVMAADSLGVTAGAVEAEAAPDTLVSASSPTDSTDVPDAAAGSDPESLLLEGLEGYVVATDSLGEWVPLVALPPEPEDEGEAERARERRRRRLLGRRPGTKVPTLMDNLFSAAEVYRDRLGLPDSAAVLYQAIADRFPGSAQIPRALFNLAWTQIEEKADTTAARPILERLVADHPATEHASAARRYLGLPEQASAEEQAAEAFAEIERLRVEFPEEPARWMPRLDDLAAAYPGTRVAARAAFLAAWTAENVEIDSAGAAGRYDSIPVIYPGSTYADLVERRRQAERDGEVDRLGRELKSLREGTDPGQDLVMVAVEPVIEDSVSRAKNHLGFGMRALRRADFTTARELFQLSLDEREGPQNTEPVVGLGEANWRQGYLEDAVDYMRQALRDRSRSILPHYRLFAHHVQRGEVDSANSYLRTIARRDRDSPGVADLILLFPGIASRESEPLETDQLERVELEPEEELLEVPPSYFGVAEPPLVRSSRPPEYPAGQTDSTTVLVDVLVSETGQPEEVALYQGDEPFASAAVAAVEGYTFYPAEGREERPVRAWVEVTVPFTPPSAGEDVALPAPVRPDEEPPLMVAGEDGAAPAERPPMPGVGQEAADGE